MSRDTNTSSYRGRYNAPVPTTNLGDMEDDLPQYEAFEEVGPRSYPFHWDSGAGGVRVTGVDMCLDVNRANHYTQAYAIQNLVVRRGQQFLIRLSFSGPLGPGDILRLEFLIGANPTPTQQSRIEVCFGAQVTGSWSGQVLEDQGSSKVLGITARPDAIVGRYRVYASVESGGHLDRTRRDPSTDIYMLFNAWCQADDVFVQNEAERMEYVMNDRGIIYQGSVGAVSQRTWMYGQFERGVLDACIFILDCSRMPIFNRGNIVKVIRKGSAMINSHDDNGVLVGNWSDDFSMGRPPTSWTGSVSILLQYANTGVPVCFAQCWVFAGVFNTFLRALGIPCRVITNFNSAHDNTGNLKTDLIFKPDGTPDKRHTRDSIWNYHCWNEVFCIRHDLPNSFWGWQVVDATPQETSDGHFRCGPASVAAIKEGQLCYPFDSGFCFAEVNSDVVFHKRDRYGNLTPFRVETAHIGPLIVTKAVGSNSLMDVTYTYKYEEGSHLDQQTMDRAEQYGCVRDHSELPDNKLTCAITSEPAKLGEPVNLTVTFTNTSDEPHTLQAHLSGNVIFYTGIPSKQFKDYDFTVTIQPHQREQVALQVTPQEYLPHLGAGLVLHFSVTGHSADQSVTAMKVVNLQTPSITLTVSGTPRVQEEMLVTLTFTNTLSFDLKNVTVSLEGSGLISTRTHKYSVIEQNTTITLTEPFTPRLAGQRCIVAELDGDNVSEVSGHIDVLIT